MVCTCYIHPPLVLRRTSAPDNFLAGHRGTLFYTVAPVESIASFTLESGDDAQCQQAFDDYDDSWVHEDVSSLSPAPIIQVAITC